MSGEQTNMDKNTRLENWYVGQYDCLYGNVYNHPKGIPDGTFVRTSRVVELDTKTSTAKTKNTGYELGAPMDWNKVPMLDAQT